MKISIPDIQDNFPKRSLSAVSQYTKNLPNFSNQQIMQIKLECPQKAIGDIVLLYFQLFAADRKHLGWVKGVITRGILSVTQFQITSFIHS